MSLSKKLRTVIGNLYDLRTLDDRCSHRSSMASVTLTLTTVPWRIDQIKPTLVSLLKQSFPPKEIHINIGRDLFAAKGKDIPSFLKDLKVVKVFEVDHDLGPATKVIPTLQRFDGTDQLIIVVDDDMYYAPNLVEKLVAADSRPQLNLSKRTSFCINGLLLPRDLLSRSRPSDKEIKSGVKRVAIVEGCGGYTVRPSYFNLSDLMDTSRAPERCLYDDDFWISGHLSRNNIAKFQIPAGRRKSLVNTITSAISGDREALQTAMMRHFKNDWKPEEYDV